VKVEVNCNSPAVAFPFLPPTVPFNPFVLRVASQPIHFHLTITSLYCILSAFVFLSCFILPFFLHTLECISSSFFQSVLHVHESLNQPHPLTSPPPCAAPHSSTRASTVCVLPKAKAAHPPSCTRPVYSFRIQPLRVQPSYINVCLSFFPKLLSESALALPCPLIAALSLVHPSLHPYIVCVVCSTLTNTLLISLDTCLCQACITSTRVDRCPCHWKHK